MKKLSALLVLLKGNENLQGPNFGDKALLTITFNYENTKGRLQQVFLPFLILAPSL